MTSSNSRLIYTEVICNLVVEEVLHFDLIGISSPNVSHCCRLLFTQCNASSLKVWKSQPIVAKPPKVVML